MLKFVSLFALLAVASVFNAQAEDLWTEDFAAAQAKAEKEGKDLLVDFTGADWCHWCVKLKEEVFDKQAFKDAAPKSFILVEADYPQTKEQPEAIKKQNAMLQEKYEIQGYPSILLMNAKGEVYARTGYQAGGPEKYLEHLNKLREGKKKYDATLAKAQAVSGLEKAKLLDEAVMALDPDLAMPSSADIGKQIMELDKDNAAGLKKKYETQAKLVELNACLQGGDADGALKKLDDILATKDLTADKKQELYFYKAMCQHEKQDVDGAIKSLETALSAAPTSEKAPQIKEAIEQLKADKKK
jgi:thioredoxin-related protein